MNGKQIEKLRADLVDVVGNLELPKAFSVGTGEADCEYHFTTASTKAEPKDILKFNRVAKAVLTDLVTGLHKQYKGRLGADVIKQEIVRSITKSCRELGWAVPTVDQLDVEGLAQAIAKAASQASGTNLVFLPVEGVTLREQVCRILGAYILKPTASNLKQVAEEALEREIKLPSWLEVPLANDQSVKKVYSSSAVVCVPVVGKGLSLSAASITTAATLLGVAGLVLHCGRFWDFRPRLVLDENSQAVAKLVVSPDGLWGAGQGHDSRQTCLGGKSHPLSEAIVAEHMNSDWSKECAQIVKEWLFGRASGMGQQLATMWGWLGRAYMATSSSEKLLFSVIALEVGVGIVKEEKIRKPLAIYTAHLLGGSGDERTRTMERVLRWYDRRSALVHSGAEASGAPDESQAFDTIVSVAQTLTERRNEWASPTDFRKYLDGLLLGV